MAEITGPLRFSGSISGMSCYWNSALKKWILRTKGGANKNLIENNRAFARTRENNVEFTEVNAWCHKVRVGLLDLDHLNYGYYMGDVVKVAKAIQLKDNINGHGERNIESSKFKSMLTDINFNEQYPFKKILMHQPEVISDDERKDIIVNFFQFRPMYELAWRKNASHYRLILTIAQLSDYICGTKKEQPTAVHPDLSKGKATVYSEWLSTRETLPIDISLTASFRDEYIPASDVTVMVGLGIEFGTEMGGNSYSWTKGDGTMAVIACL